MACMDHECLDCGEWWADNSTDRECPFCGSMNTTMFFDEYPEPHPEEEEWEEEEEPDE